VFERVIGIVVFSKITKWRACLTISAFLHWMCTYRFFGKKHARPPMRAMLSVA
jgi:hypothetical protein